jgi:hypothetical protein
MVKNTCKSLQIWNIHQLLMVKNSSKSMRIWEYSPVQSRKTAADQCKSGNIHQLLMVKNSCRSKRIRKYTPVADGQKQLQINANSEIYTSR